MTGLCVWRKRFAILYWHLEPRNYMNTIRTEIFFIAHTEGYTKYASVQKLKKHWNIFRKYCVLSDQKSGNPVSNGFSMVLHMAAWTVFCWAQVSASATGSLLAGWVPVGLAFFAFVTRIQRIRPGWKRWTCWRFQESILRRCYSTCRSNGRNA